MPRRKTQRTATQRHKRHPLTELLLLLLFILVVMVILLRPWERFDQRDITTTTVEEEDKKNLRGSSDKSGFDMDWLLYLVGSVLFLLFVFFVYTSKTSLKKHSGLEGSLDTWGDEGFIDRAKIIGKMQGAHLQYWWESLKLKIKNMLSREKIPGYQKQALGWRLKRNRDEKIEKIGKDILSL